MKVSENSHKSRLPISCAPATQSHGRRLAVLVCVLIALAASSVVAEVSTPLLVGTSRTDGCTLGIPRWKGYMSATNPNRFWMAYANGGSSNGNLNYTTNGGDSFSSNTIQIGATGSVDFHLSCFGYQDDLYFTWPYTDIMFRKFNYPAQSDSDRESLRTLSGTSAQHRSNVMVDNNGRIWVFTRLSDSPSQNVRYQYSDNGGSSWTTGVAYSTGTSNVRIGSMPYIDGRPALVVLHCDDNRGYEYYLWNGSTFEARPDHSIYAANMGNIRVFTHNVIRDTTFHLIFGLGNTMHHLWKNYNNGSGSWNHETIESSSNTDDFDWYPISTVQGDYLHLFYCKKSSSSFSSSNIYHMRWSQLTRTWSSPELVSTSPASGSNRDPNTCFQVPETSDYIPVFWWRGTGDYNIYFAKVSTTAAPADTIPPGKIEDLGATSGPGAGEITLSWSAPGDDGMDGAVDHYEVKSSSSLITDANWNTQEELNNPPFPLQPGQTQIFEFDEPKLGPVIYYAVKAFDEAGNASVVSNNAFLASSYVDEDNLNGLLPTTSRLLRTYPNPFNNTTSIQYWLDHPSEIDLSVFNIRGQRVTTLVHEPQPRGQYEVEWAGLNMAGNPVATGVYLCQLVAGNAVDSHKLLLLK